MVELSIQIEGFGGLNWPRWKRLVSEVERLGFAGLYLCDHYNAPGTIGLSSLEMTVALTYLADHSQRLRFGPLVAPLSYRDPVMLARQAMALDDLSGGRMVLGVGAGWIEDEHRRFGYDFGDARTRIDRLAEGLEVITRLCRDEGPVSFEGRFYRLWEAQLAPRSPKPGGPTILVGGKGMRRLLPLIARFADVWTSSRLPLDIFRERSQLLDGLLERQDRPRQAVKRTIMDIVVCWRDEAELDRRIGFLRRLRPDFAALAPTELLEALRTLLGHVIDGVPEAIVEEIRAYEAAGVQEIMIDWFEVDDVEGLQVLADEVLPRLTTSAPASSPAISVGR
jgi:alkanesulfonate monooxygenase SsuD/methylene tetrahydromethanopterin reductase-like flavin-dependent oxidoreductase (luciferase family)